MATRIVCDDSHLSCPSTNTSICVKRSSPSTLNSTRHRHRLLRRLKERLHLPSSDLPLNEYGNKPTVIRVGGTVSSCASSTVLSRASQGGGTWRLLEELFGRNGSTPPGASTISSTKSSRSNKTIVYDDQWDNDHCTVVTVADTVRGRAGGAAGQGQNRVTAAAEHARTAAAELEPTSDPGGQQYTGGAVSGHAGGVWPTGSTVANLALSTRASTQARSATGATVVTVNAVDEQECATSSVDNNSHPSVEERNSTVPSDRKTSGFQERNTSDARTDLVFPQSADQCNQHSQAGAAGADPTIGSDSQQCPLHSNPSVSNREPGAPVQMCSDNILLPPGHHALAPEELLSIYPRNAWNTSRMPFQVEEEEEDCKGCCGSRHGSQTMCLRWFIAIITLIGVSCVVVGIVLGALIASGSTRLTLCLLMIGVGLVLMTVSGITWRLTITGSSCDCLRMICCLDSNGQYRRTRRPRHQATILLPGRNSSNAYSRVHSLHRNQRHCSAQPNFCFPPEFLWRPPPPSYNASVQDDPLRRVVGHFPTPCTVNSPPPTYRSHIDMLSSHRPSVVDVAQLCVRPGAPRQTDVVQIDTMNATDPRMQSTSSAADCVVMPEPVQQDEGASLVLNEQLQSTSGQPEAYQDRITRRNAVTQFTDFHRLNERMRTNLPPAYWISQYPPQFGPHHHPGSIGSLLRAPNSLRTTQHGNIQQNHQAAVHYAAAGGL